MIIKYKLTQEYCLSTNYMYKRKFIFYRRFSNKKSSKNGQEYTFKKIFFSLVWVKYKIIPKHDLDVDGSGDWYAKEIVDYLTDKEYKKEIMEKTI